MIVTIDGPAGAGKSTVARALAVALGAAYLDTGATYRAATLKALREGLDLTDAAALAEMVARMDLRLIPDPAGVRVLLDGEDVSREIRSAEVTESSHYLARCLPVREKLVDLQRRMGSALGDFVAEGRDQGSVVFPHADCKFYLDAAPAVRAKRRCEELAEGGQAADYDEVLQAVVQRDERDRTRAVAPLTCPAGAVVIDTSAMTIEDVVRELVRRVEARR